MPGSPEGEQPRPLSSDQSKPSVEGGKSPAGLPINLPEHDNYQQESVPTGPSGEKKSERDNPGRAVFNCAIPESKETPSLFQIQSMLRDGMITEEEVPVLKQQWLESLNTMDKRSLEQEAHRWENERDAFIELQQRKHLTVHGQALLPTLNQQLNIIREYLNKRE